MFTRRLRTSDWPIKSFFYSQGVTKTCPHNPLKACDVGGGGVGTGRAAVLLFWGGSLKGHRLQYWIGKLELFKMSTFNYRSSIIDLKLILLLKWKLSFLEWIPRGIVSRVETLLFWHTDDAFVSFCHASWECFMSSRSGRQEAGEICNNASTGICKYWHGYKYPRSVAI